MYTTSHMTALPYQFCHSIPKWLLPQEYPHHKMI